MPPVKFRYSINVYWRYIFKDLIYKIRSSCNRSETLHFLLSDDNYDIEIKVIIS